MSQVNDLINNLHLTGLCKIANINLTKYHLNQPKKKKYFKPWWALGELRSALFTIFFTFKGKTQNKI